jgi:HD-GYP domain-containing protein (c-di-GMP phosphodiesterase class II)
MSKINPFDNNLMDIILSGITDAVFITGLDFKIRIFKGASEKIFGYSVKEAVGKNIETLVQDAPQSISDINFIGKDRIFNGTAKGGRKISLELIKLFEYTNDRIIWIFREQATNKKLEAFLDAYHDNIEIELIRQVNEKNRSLENLTIALVTALEDASFFHDKETGIHIHRMSEISKILAERLGYPPEFVRKIKLYAPLHDTGKVGVPEKILKKKGKYTPVEARQMESHVIIGARMLDYPEIDIIAKNIALYHHEKWDGTGYVHKLKGPEIPIEARIVSVADVYDALRSERIYKAAFSKDRANDMIYKLRGISFDPVIVDAFLDNAVLFNDVFEKFQ